MEMGTHVELLPMERPDVAATHPDLLPIGRSSFLEELNAFPWDELPPCALARRAGRGSGCPGRRRGWRIPGCRIVAGRRRTLPGRLGMGEIDP